jgi:hypothetical protein
MLRLLRRLYPKKMGTITFKSLINRITMKKNSRNWQLIRTS